MIRYRPRRLRLALLVLLAGALSFAWPLPEEARPGEGVSSLRVTDRDGRLLRELYPDGRGHPVPLASVNPSVVDALIATEDRRFFRHPGIDPLALGRAARQNVRARRVVSGGSTISMQVARAIRGGDNRGIGAKLAEAHLAIRLELRSSKEEILTLWLDRVPFGNRSFGIEAAARTYFGKGAADLTLDEATLLIGLPQAPSRLDPFRHPDRALERRGRVLDALYVSGGIDARDRDRLAAMPLSLVEPRRTFRAPHFVEWVARDAPAGTAVLGTTLDAALQEAVESIIRTHVRALRMNRVSAAAAVVIDNITGDILAYAGSADFWDEAASGQVDGVRALRQPGSALKPFTYALALGDGRWTAASILPDLPLQVPEAGGAFSPENYDRQFHGPVPVRVALASSLNVPAVRVARELGTDPLLETLHRAGFRSLQQSAEHYGVGLALGSGEVRLIELGRAYAGLARGGALPRLRAVRFATTASGDTISTPIGGSEPMGINPATAYLVTDILADPHARVIGFGRGGPLELPFPAAVKTGTTKDYRDNWAAGYTPRHTVAVWIGNFDNTPMQWVSGTRGTGPILNAILTHLGDAGPFTRPGGVEEVTVCPLSGARPGSRCPGLQRELFLSGTAPTDTCNVHRVVDIDRRTGLLADESTPADDVDARPFVVHPPEFHAWMRERGLLLPPTAAFRHVSGEESGLSASLRIDYPADGTVFHLDPVLRPEFQRARLRGSADESLLNVAWYANGRPLSNDLHGTDWRLTSGTHTLELRALAPDGRRVRSVPARVTVRGGTPQFTSSGG